MLFASLDKTQFILFIFAQKDKVVIVSKYSLNSKLLIFPSSYEDKKYIMMKFLALLAVFAAVSGTKLFYENYRKKKSTEHCILSI